MGKGYQFALTAGMIKLTLCYTPKKWTISTGAAAGGTRVLKSMQERWTRRMLFSKALFPMMTIEGHLIVGLLW